MKEFTAKKLGEVMAFVEVGITMSKRGSQALEAGWGAKEFITFKKLLLEQKSQLTRFADKTALDKSRATIAKLTGMMEAYIKDEWGNPAELMEWSGFYFGSAIIHWALVGAATKGENLTELAKISDVAVTANYQMLDISKSSIEAIAKRKISK